MPRRIEDIFQPVTIRNTVLAEHISVFTTYHIQHYAKETVKTYSKALQSFLSFILVDRNFKYRLTDFERYAVYLSQVKHLSPATVSTYLTALRRFCQYLVESKELPRNPAKRIHGGTIPKKLPTFFTQIELQSVLKSSEYPTLRDLRDIAMMHAILSCFLTEQELHKAQVKDVSVEERCIFINDEKVPMTKNAMSALQAYLQMRFGTQQSHYEMPLFESHSNRSKGLSISIRGIRDTLHQRLMKLGVPDERKSCLSAYTFRHTGGCLLAIAGYSDEHIMQKMRLKWKTSALQYLQLQQKAISEGLEECLYLID